MQIIISPAKKMRTEQDFLAPTAFPVYLEKARVLHQYLAALPYPALKKLLGCNDAIATLAYQRYQEMELDAEGTPALFAYDGIQYQYMKPGIFTEAAFSYVQEHLRILSGFYGILKPFDGVQPYRLEMQAKVQTDFCKDLYAYWGASLYKDLQKEEGPILNLASEEYAKAVRPHISCKEELVTPIFGEEVGDKVVEKGVYVKMARGDMVRFLAENQITSLEAVKEYSGFGYQFRPGLSSATHLVFTRPEQKGASHKKTVSSKRS